MSVFFPSGITLNPNFHIIGCKDRSFDCCIDNRWCHKESLDKLTIDSKTGSYFFSKPWCCKSVCTLLDQIASSTDVSTDRCKSSTRILDQNLRSYQLQLPMVLFLRQIHHNSYQPLRSDLY